MILDPLTQLDEIEDRLVARLVAGALSFAGNVAAFGDVEAMKRAAKRYPFCAVVRSPLGDEWDQPQSFTSFTQQGTMAWEAYAFSRSQRGRKAARRGTAGSYKLSGEIVGALRLYDPIEDVVANIQQGGHPIYLVDRRAYEDQDTGGAIYIEKVTLMHAVEI